jgi:hypothetical protein
MIFMPFSLIRKAGYGLLRSKITKSTRNRLATGRCIIMGIINREQHREREGK